MEQGEDGNGSLVLTLNRLLRDLHLQTLQLEDLNDLTPSFLLVILEALLHERLPISKSIRESRSPSSKVEAMKIFLGVLADDLLVQGGFGETVISEVAEIDPRKLARGEYEECFIIGEVLCRFAMSRGLLQAIHKDHSPELPSPQRGDGISVPHPADETPNQVPRAPSPFSVADISPPSRREPQNSPTPSSSRSNPKNTVSSSPTQSQRPSQAQQNPSVLIPIKRSTGKDARMAEASSHLAQSPIIGGGFELGAEETFAPEYHATTAFLADSSTASLLSRSSSPTQSLCNCNRTFASEADSSYCTCGASHTLPHLSSTLGEDDSNQYHPSQSEATLLDEDNPFTQFAQSRLPLDLLTSRTVSRTMLGAAGQMHVEDQTIYAHPTLVRRSGHIERVDPDQDYEEFLRSHPHPQSSQLNSHPQSSFSRFRVSQMRDDRLGPTRHSSPSEYRLALLNERARLYAEIARARAEAAAEA